MNYGSIYLWMYSINVYFFIYISIYCFDLISNNFYILIWYLAFTALWYIVVPEKRSDFLAYFKKRLRKGLHCNLVGEWVKKHFTCITIMFACVVKIAVISFTMLLVLKCHYLRFVSFCMREKWERLKWVSKECFNNYVVVFCSRCVPDWSICTTTKF